MEKITIDIDREMFTIGDNVGDNKNAFIVEVTEKKLDDLMTGSIKKAQEFIIDEINKIIETRNGIDVYHFNIK